MEHIQSVMHLGKKYQMDECLKYCTAFLMKNLTIGETCLGYQLAIHYDQHDLKKYCRDQIEINAEEVLKSDGFLNCDWNVLNDIVKSDHLNCREIVLLEACINWGQNACKRNQLNAGDEVNMRNQLKDVIYEVRFNEISVVEFAKYLNDSQSIYNKDDLEDIIRILGRENLTSTKFNLSERFNPICSNSWNDSDKLVCEIIDVKRDAIEHNIPNIVSKIFSTNKWLILGSFALQFKDLIQDVCISMERNGSEIQSIQRFAKPKDNSNIVILPKPIVIRKDIKYKIQLNYSSNNKQLSRYYRMNQKVELENGSIITFHRDSSSDFNNVEQGAIDELHFNEYKN